MSECKKYALTIKDALELHTEPSMDQALDEASSSSITGDSPESDTSPSLFVPIKKTSKKKGRGQGVERPPAKFMALFLFVFPMADHR